MELQEVENVLLDCETEENKDKYTEKKLNFQLNDKDVEVSIFTKKDNENNVIIENLKDLDENEISDNIYTELKNNKCKSIGVVIYMQKRDYKENADENKSIHIRDANAPSFLALIIKKIFEEMYKSKIIELIMGHEHGTKNNKCHLQIIINFENMFRKIMKPGAMKIKYNSQYTCLVFMQQKTKNPHALKNYCLKERDATITRGDNEILKFEPKDTESPFTYIRDNYNKITVEEARQCLLESDPKLYFKNCSNFEMAIKKIVVAEPKVEFRWMPIPEYLKEYYLPDGSTFYDKFNEWYTKYCINGNELDRKKAICLYSRQRSMGKSYFARHLVSDPGYVLEFNNTFCWKENMNKGIYRLLLLDDMGIISANNKAMWKSLVASEPTTLRGAWLNEPFNERLPCIITTNDIEMIKIFRDDPLFNTQVSIIEIPKYLGAPGTQREDLMHNDFILSYETSARLNAMNHTKDAYNNSNNL